MRLATQDIQLILNAPNRRNNVGVRNRAILQLLFHGGFTVSETVAIERSELDLQRGLVRGQRLPMSAIHALEAWLNVAPASAYLLCTVVTGQGLIGYQPPGAALCERYVYRMVRRYGEQSGINATPRRIRLAAGVV